MADWVAVLIASVAAVVSVVALKQSKRYAEDFGGGTHAIAYREHVWFLHNQGLSDEQIEGILRMETFRPDVPLNEGNAYDGANGSGGLRSEIGSVAQILRGPAA